MTLQIGSILWTYDRYASNLRWGAYRIFGETRQSWIVSEGYGRDNKIKKDTLQENLGKCGDRQWYTGQGKDDCVWLSENKFKIIEQVSRCSDIQKLKLVNDLICDSKEPLR